MQKGRSAAQVAEDEQRLFDGMLLICGEENVIQPETEPMDEHTEGPDDEEERKENNAFSSEAGGGVF